MNDADPQTPKHTFISLGYRCSAAGILKRLGLKQESFPFDWLISRLPVVQHCIESGFKEFLHIPNYIKKSTITYHHFKSELEQEIVCRENLVVNAFYQPSPGGADATTDPINTYQYHLAMNHHDIVETPEHYQYYERCIERLYNVLQDNGRPHKIVVHITPLYTIEYYDNHSGEIYNECLAFHSFLVNGFSGVKGIYFIMVKNIERKPSWVQMTETDNLVIYILYTNHGFVDAGETFMGDYTQEETFIRDAVQWFQSKCS